MNQNINIPTRVLSWVCCIVAGLVLVSISLILLRISDNLENIFNELGIKIPILTVFVLEISTNYKCVVFIIIAIIQIILEMRFNGSNKRLMINGVYLFLSLIFMAIVVIGIFSPLIHIISNISNQTAT